MNINNRKVWYLSAAAALCTALAPAPLCAESVTADDVTSVVVGWKNAKEALGEQLEAEPVSVKEYSGLGGTGTYYVVSLEGGGFVVTSGDTSFEPVLAYSKTGTWVDDVKRNPLMAMVEIDIAAATAAGLAERSSSVKSGGVRLGAGGSQSSATAGDDDNAVATQNAAKWAKYKAGASKKGGLRLGASAPNSDLRVAALLQSAWSQSGNGENYYTPGASTAGNPGFVCGCVATMCAQIMRYWEWPKGTNITAIANYTGTVTYGKDDAAVSTEWDLEGGYYRTKTATTKTSWTSYSWPAFGGTYDWANMPLTFTYGTSTLQKKAIGHLTRDCGIACGMNYADGGSGAPGPAFAHRAVDQFAYTSGKCVNGWNDANRDALLASLDAGIPCGFCIYGDGGHAVVADGYGYSGGTLYIHFNYGWGSTGPSDWYTPPNVGTFTSVGEIIFNVYPPSVSKHDLTIVSGRVLSGTTAQSSVTVTATNRESGFSTNVTSNSKGIYSFMLPRGYYSFTATKSGSSAKVEADVTPCIAGTASNARSGNIHGLDLKLGTAVTAPSVALTHRWSFNDNLNDSVGSSNASKIGSNVNLVDGKAVCTGNGAGQGSLNLGSNLLDTDGATIEIWAANDEVKGGSRIFEYGVDTGHYFMMAWTKSTDLYVDCAEAFSDGANNIYDGALAPFTLGRQYHIAVTFERQGDGTTKVRATRRDAASGAIQRVAVYSVTNGIHTFSSPILRLGRSFQGNADARATYDEVRVWQGVLSDAQLKASALAGPDVNLSTLPWNASAVRYVAKAIWQGGTTAPTASSLASSANWSCTDQNGDAITGVPDHRSVVIIPNGTTAFTIPEGFTPNWRKLQIGSEGKATAQWGKKTYTQTSVSAQLDPTSADYTLQGDANVDELARSVAPSVQDAPAGLSGKQFRYDGWVYVTAAQAGRWAVSAYADDYAAFRLDDEWLAFTRVMDDGIRTAVADVPKGWHRFTVIIGDYYGGFGGCAVPTDHSCATPVTISIDGGNSIAFTSSNFQFGSPDRAAPVVTLAGDADWSSIGEVSLDSGAELDLNGHTLTIDKMDSSFLGANIKDTSATPGTIAFAEGGAVNSGNITVQSNVKTAYANAEALITAEATFWLDASDVSTITTNASGEVTRWDSRVGSNYATQGRNYFAGSAFLYPTYDATTYGIPTVDFGNAVQSGWDNSNPGRDLNINTPVAVKTVFFVTRIQNDGKAAWLGQEDAAAYTSNCFRRDENGAYNDKRSGQPGQSRFANFWIGTDVVADMTTEHPPADKFCVFSAQMDDAGTYEAQHLAEQCGGLHSGGKQLSELIIFNRALSDAERTEVTQYLQMKWLVPHATLTHRWSFNGSTDAENLTDSVGGAVAKKRYKSSNTTTVDGGTVTWSDGKAITSGGDGGGHLNMGTGILGTGDAATIELWVTKLSKPTAWSYIFSYNKPDVANCLTFATSIGSDNSRTKFEAGGVSGSTTGKENAMIPQPVGVTYHYSVTFQSDGSGGTVVRWMTRNAETGGLLSEFTHTVNSWTLASAAANEWALTLACNPWVNGRHNVNAAWDEVRVWDGVLSDEQLTANVLAGPNATLGGGTRDVLIGDGETFVVPTAGGYGYKTDSAVALGAGTKIRFDTTGYFGKGLRFKTGGFVLPSGSVLDYVELSDTANYAATMEDVNTILVQLKSTIPYESTWIGGTPSTAADLSNTANWASTNAQGSAISAVPAAKTTVIIPPVLLPTFTIPDGATVNCGRALLGGHTKAKYGFKDGSPDNAYTTWRDLAFSGYTTVSDIPNGKNDISYFNGTKDTPGTPSEMGTAQIRIDGWFYVTAAQAGKWKFPNFNDDVTSFAIDGVWLYLNNTYRQQANSGCFVSEGWHRYTLAIGDTGGGWGARLKVESIWVPVAVSINGASNIAFTDANFTFGSDADTVTLSQDCDWRALGDIDVSGGLTIDLNGHALAVTDIGRSSLGASIVNNSETAASLYVNGEPSSSAAQTSGTVDSSVSILQVGSRSASWTGGANNGGNALTPGNWTVRNGAGMTVSGGLPDSETIVVVSGDHVNLQIPSGSTFQCASLTIQDCTLTADCDWRGLAVTPTITGTADLNGHDLRLNHLTANADSALANSGEGVSGVIFDATAGDYNESSYVDGLANLGTSENAHIIILRNGDDSMSSLNVGNTANVWTEVRVTGGSFTSSANPTEVGYVSGANGVFTIDGGNVTLNSLRAQKGNFAGSGTVNVKSGSLTITGWTDYGNGSSGTATFNQSGGTVESRGSFWFGRDGSGTATYNMTGGNLNFTAGSFHLGQTVNTKGIFNQSGGDVEMKCVTEFGINSGSAGTYNMTGGRWVTTKYISLGHSNGSGTMNVSNGVVRCADTIHVAYKNTGTLNIYNGGDVTSLPRIIVGSNGGTGSLNVYEGGKLVTPQLSRNKNTGNVTFAGGTIVATNAVSPFFSNLTDITLGKGGMTVDSAGQDIAITAGTFTTTPGSMLRKVGAGKFTMHTLPSVDKVKVEGGTLALSADADNSAPAPVLAHRWSFTGGSLADSVGSSTAEVAGSSSGTATLANNAVTLPGGNRGTCYVDLGNNVFPASGAVTLEIWATQNATQPWSRMFAIGSADNNKLAMFWTYDTNVNQDAVQLKISGSDYVWERDTMQPYTLGTKYHISMVIVPGEDGKSTLTWTKRDAVTGEVLKSKSVVTSGNWKPADFVSRNLWLGHGYSNNDAAATYDEVRIWNGALGEESLTLSAQKGPDAAASELVAIAAGRVLELAGGTLDLGGHTLTQPVVKGNSGTVQNGTLNVDVLTIGGDGTSGTIALNVASVSGVIRIDNGDTFTTTTAGLDLSGVTIDLAFTPTAEYTLATASGSGTFAGVPALTINGASLRGWKVKVSADGKTLRVSKTAPVIMVL